MKLKVILVIWFGLSILNFGAMNSEIKYDSENQFQILHLHQRDSIGIIIFESCVFAPLELFTVAFITNFYQHGWTLRSW